MLTLVQPSDLSLNTALKETVTDFEFYTKLLRMLCIIKNDMKK